MCADAVSLSIRWRVWGSAKRSDSSTIHTDRLHDASVDTVTTGDNSLSKSASKLSRDEHSRSPSENGTVKILHAKTYRLENTLGYALKRAWWVGLW